MSSDIPLYSGPVAVAPRQQFVSPAGVPHVESPGGAINAAIERGLNTVFEYAKMSDFGKMQELQLEQYEQEVQMRSEFAEAMALPNGAEGAFFHEDGSLNNDKVGEFVSRWQDKNAEVQRTFLTREAGVKAAYSRRLVQQNIANMVSLMTRKEEFVRRENVFNMNLETCLLKNDWDGAYGNISAAEQNGLKSKVDAAHLRARVDAARVRHLASLPDSQFEVVSVDGRPYQGFAAVLAAQAKKDGWTGLAHAEGGKDEKVQAPGCEGGKVLQVELGQADDISIDPRSLDCLASLPKSCFVSVAESLGNDNYVKVTPGFDGRMAFDCGATALPAVKRLAAQANEYGEVSPEAVRCMVAAIVADSVTQNPRVSAGEIMPLFEKAGVFEALGGGNADQGKVRVQAVVDEWLERASGGTTKVNMQLIDALIDRTLESEYFGRNYDWFNFGELNPGVGDDEWERDALDEAGQARWDRLRCVYKKHRAEFLAEQGEAVPEVLRTREVEKWAQRFWVWYRRKKEREEVSEAKRAAREFYRAEILERLHDALAIDERTGEVEYSGYASEVELVQQVLNVGLPDDLGVAAYERAMVRLERKNADDSSGFRRLAADMYERLGAMKRQQRERAEAEKVLEKAEEKKQRAREKAEAVRERRRVQMERLRPRSASWAWDGAAMATGSRPMVSIPEEEFEAVVQTMDYDGDKPLYVSVNGQSLLVTGTNKDGKMRLNAAAVKVIQPKPHTMRGEKYALDGDLDFFYIIKD